MKRYYRVMLGKKSIYAAECIAGNFIGADFGIVQDLTTKLPEEWRTFNKEFIPVFLSLNPTKTKVAAGLACGALWTVAKGIRKGDVVLCPDGDGRYYIGEIASDYFYAFGQNLPHRRTVRWLGHTIDRSEMSDSLRNSAGSIGTVSDITRHQNEIERFIYGAPSIVAIDESIEDPSSFAMEKHLEDFLVQNWSQTELGKLYDIYKIEGENVGQQYPTDTGPIDILAMSKDKKKLLVVELKKGRASDNVVGQILRYMGFVQDELAEDNQQVHGVIIALEDDQRIRRALKMAPNIDFYRYQVSFKLVKA